MHWEWQTTFTKIPTFHTNVQHLKFLIQQTWTQIRKTISHTAKENRKKEDNYWKWKIVCFIIMFSSGFRFRFWFGIVNIIRNLNGLGDIFQHRELFHAFMLTFMFYWWLLSRWTFCSNVFLLYFFASSALKHSAIHFLFHFRYLFLLFFSTVMFGIF